MSEYDLLNNLDNAQILVEAYSTENFDIAHVLNDPEIDDETKQLVLKFVNLQPPSFFKGNFFLEVLNGVWNYIQQHEHRANIKEILMVEIKEANKYNYARKVYGLVNALQGFM